MNLKRLCLTPLDFFFYILTISINHNYVINQYNNPTGIFLYLSFYPSHPGPLPGSLLPVLRYILNSSSFHHCIFTSLIMAIICYLVLL